MPNCILVYLQMLNTYRHEKYSVEMSSIDSIAPMSIFYPVLLLQARKGESDGVVYRMSSKPFTKWGINGNVIDAAALMTKKDNGKKESKDAETNVQNSRKSNTVMNENGEDIQSSSTKFSELMDGCIYDFQYGNNQSNRDRRDDTEVVVRIFTKIDACCFCANSFDTAISITAIAMF